ncbi:hypothetical protein ACWA7J_00355 [Leptothrix sp. BB-4]
MTRLIPRLEPALTRTLCVALVAVTAALTSVVACASPVTGLVVVDQAALRAAPRDSAPLHLPLWRGEAMELRGASGDWVQVWDPQRERGGYLRATQVISLPTGPEAVPELAAQLRLLRQLPGSEALGIGLAAALIERAPAPWLASPAGAEMLDTLVLLNERLAQRVQTAASGAQQTAAAAHAEVAQRYGFALRSVPRADGGLQPCPAVQPAVLLRGHPAATPAQQARAALSLTRSDCLPADALPSQRRALLEQQVAWLDSLSPTALAPVDRNRLLLRRASVLASLSFLQRDGTERATATLAFAAWSQLIALELSPDEAPAVRDAALRLSPARWLLQPAVDAVQLGRFELRLQDGGPGETCLVLRHADAPDTSRRCSHGRIHLNSARLSPDGSVVVLGVQPLDGWTELWRLDANGRLDVLPPSGESPGLGAVEWAGWVPSKGGKDRPQMLIAREADAGGRQLRRFEIYDTDLLQATRWVAEPGQLSTFQRSSDAAWRGNSTIAR